MRLIPNEIINKFLNPRSIKSLFTLCFLPRNYLFFPKDYSPKWVNDSHSPATRRSSPDTPLVQSEPRSSCDVYVNVRYEKEQYF
jgi:hypothetical protein